MLVLGGLGLLYAGHKQEWFLGALAAGKLHSLTYYLAWAITGVTYSVLATFVWSRLDPKAGKTKVLLAFLVFSAVVVTGSQFAARRVISHLALAIDSVAWDPVSKEFVVHVMSTPAIAAAHQRGALEALVSIEGFWESERVRSQGRIYFNVDLVTAGSPDLAGQRGGVLPIDLDYSNLVEFGVLRVPWIPYPERKGTAYPTCVNAALMNQEGKRIGIISSARF